MLSQEDLFAKALMVEEPWFVDKVNSTLVKSILIMFPTRNYKEPKRISLF
jgi:hypothetical protein